jgi:ABC-type multidrug transport system ATPase subunit
MLSIAELTHVYANGVRALDAVSLDIPAGMFGLLGPNGAGKSSLMRCLATLQVPTSGQIRFGTNDGSGIDVLREPAKLRATLGYLPQDFGVYPRVSAIDMLDHLAVLKGVGGRGERRETIEALLRQVNLWDVRKKAIAGFSGGMRQRFGIAQALIGSPRMLLLDEPTSALDPAGRRTVRALLEELRGRGVSVLLNSHLLSEVELVCDRVAIIARGAVVAAGTPAELSHAGGVEVETASGARVFHDARREDAPRIVRELVAAGEEVFGVRVLTSTLEDAYLEAVGGR